MAEVEETIPENSESITEAAPETKEVVEEPTTQEPAKRGRGRPTGSKDRAHRTTKPKVRIEPIPQPAVPKQAAPAPAPQQPVHSAPEQTSPREEPAVYEPRSPKTIFRIYQETVAQDRQRRKHEHASAYVANCSQWLL